ncbi:MAG: hypothetical protein ACQEP5_06920 [Actinomycetota bacterium]
MEGSENVSGPRINILDEIDGQLAAAVLKRLVYEHKSLLKEIKPG